MFPVRNLCLAFGLLVFVQFATAQTVVNSTYIGPAYGTYSLANNWAPAEVPNNTDTKNYNVTVPPTISLIVDIDATISNLTLGSFLDISGKVFAVTGTTLSPADQAPGITVESSGSAPGTFNAGTLSAFSGNTLEGRYIVRSGGAATTLQFNGANVVTFGEGELSLYGPLAKVVDENGNDGLRNLARVESGAALELDGHDLTVNVPFTNNGTVTLGGFNATIFTIANSLGNFDPGTRTLSGGQFVLRQFATAPGSLPIELRFDGADIVNNGSAIELLSANSRITDLAGNDGLRNLARILSGASLTLMDHDFATAGDFGNDGLLSLTRSNFVVAGPLADFDPTTRTLSGGTYEIMESDFKFSGADIVHNGASITLINGGDITDLAGNSGLRNFSDNLARGIFIIGQDTGFTAAGDFTNAGTVKLASTTFSIPEQQGPPGTFTVPPGFSYTQTAGVTENTGTLTADRVNILGGLFYHYGTIQGDVLVTDATLFPSRGAVINGNLTFGSGSRYRTTVSGPNSVQALTGVPGKIAVAGTLEVGIRDQVFVGSDAVLTILQSNTSITGAFGNAPNGARIPTVDGRGSFVVVYEAQRVTLTQFMATPPPVQLLNISTRAFVFRPSDDPIGDRRTLIGGFIISGAEPKTVALRGIGPSLSKFGLDPTLVDPVLELHSSSGGVIVTNDNWRDTQATEILQSGLAPEDEREAVIITTLSPGTYTVVLKEKNGLAGYGLVEVYDLSKSSSSKLANISTRGYTDANTVLIGGIIVAGDGQVNDDVVIRALGPQMRQGGIFDALQDPTLELRDSNGSLMAFNDDWFANYDQIPEEFRSLQSTESAMRVSLAQGSYTAIVRPKGNDGGVGLVEFYDLRR